MSAGTLEAVLTPVERHGELWLKREDLWEERSPDGRIVALGAKARTAGIICRKILREGARGICTSLDRNSSVPGMLSRVCEANGVELHLYLPASADPWPAPFFEAHAHGAHLYEIRPGYMSVRNARLREQIARSPYRLRRVGLGLSYYGAGFEETAAQVANVPDEVKRIVVPVGSGRMLQGVAAGGIARFDAGRPWLSVLGVCCGKPLKLGDLFRPSPSFLETVPAGVPFSKAVTGAEVGGVPLDEVYEAKCLPFLKPGDLLWVVANRGTE